MSSSRSASPRRRELTSLSQEEVGFVLSNLGLSKHVSSFARFGVGEIHPRNNCSLPPAPSLSLLLVRWNRTSRPQERKGSGG